MDINVIVIGFLTKFPMSVRPSAASKMVKLKYQNIKEISYVHVKLCNKFE